MGFFNEKQHLAFVTGKYICPKCGKLMEFEDEWESVLICKHCGFDMDVDDYGTDEEDENEDTVYWPGIAEELESEDEYE